MADVPERLFRDDAGAALERAARLEQENQQLRAELRRFQRPDEVPTLRTRRQKPPFAAFIVGASVGLLLLGGAVVTMAAPSAPRFHPVTMVMPPPVAPGVIGVSTPAPLATVSDADDCETPYSYDEQGVKHYKMSCIHPERAR